MEFRSEFRRLKSKYKLSLLILVFVGGLSWLFQLVMSINIEMEPLEDLGRIIEQVVNSRRQNPINEIYFGKSMECEVDSELITLYNFGGTERSCVCENKVRPHRCWSTELLHCKTLEGQKEVNMTQWPRPLCVKRVKKWVLNDAQKYCNAGYKRCTDDICVGEDEICPINGIEIDSLSNKIVVQRDEKLLPFNKLEVTVGNIPCVSPIRKPERQRGGVHNLFKQQERGCGVFGLDYENTQMIDEMLEKEFYQENQLYEQFNRSIPEFEQLMRRHEKVYLTGRRVFPRSLNSETCNEEYMNKTKDNLMYVNAFYKKSGFTATTGFLVISALYVFVLLLFVTTCTGAGLGIAYKCFGYAFYGLSWPCCIFNSLAVLITGCFGCFGLKWNPLPDELSLSLFFLVFFFGAPSIYTISLYSTYNEARQQVSNLLNFYCIKSKNVEPIINQLLYDSDFNYEMINIYVANWMLIVISIILLLYVFVLSQRDLINKYMPSLLFILEVEPNYKENVPKTQQSSLVGINTTNNHQYQPAVIELTEQGDIDSHNNISTEHVVSHNQIELVDELDEEEEKNNL